MVTILVNFHTHTTFCDGKNTAEEMVRAAIEKGFSAIGFSGHGYTAFDTSYCMADTDGYCREIRRLQTVYAGKIDIALGVEEDAHAPVNDERFEYRLGSSHYVLKNGTYYPVDLSRDALWAALDAWGGDTHAYATDYYAQFCSYIREHKPHIIGHFDLLTKYEEQAAPLFLQNEEYHRIAKHYLLEALRYDCLFEVNAGAVSRGYRTAPYPHESLLYLLAKNGGKVILSSDSHCIETLDSGFDDARVLLKECGFTETYTLKQGKTVKISL